MNTVVFTDLDGTLLDAGTYSFEAALPALKLLRDRGIPVVIVSSKTRAEVELWRRRLKNEHPFITENGGAIFFPREYFPFQTAGIARDDYQVISLGKAYAHIRKQFVELRDRMHVDVRGFGDMSVEEVAALTRLGREEAELAMQREYTEPFIFSHGTDELFLRAFEAEKLRWTQGEFFHAMGNHHKGKAVEKLRALYKRKQGEAVLAIGIGDSLNDLPFLLAVDRPVLVKKNTGKHDRRVDIPGLLRTNAAGSAGWNEAIHELIKK